ncbi:MAG: hypothetical protein HFJ02_04685 [Bacilli bacterium]|jgi:putative Mn2+ efflux pump MntP|nr:hypothetical protein [Bacilli bacterium]
MKELITLITIAIALSMDTFSLSLGIGTTNLSSKKCFLFSMIVGIMHFFMPLLGIFIGVKIVSLFALKSNFLLGIILIYLGITMIIEILHPDTKEKKMNLINMFLFAIGVSIDSFSTGIGLSAITSNILLATFIFSITSFSFTYFGLIIGKYASALLGIYANVFGAILLLVIGLFHLCL